MCLFITLTSCHCLCFMFEVLTGAALCKHTLHCYHYKKGLHFIYSLKSKPYYVLVLTL